MLKDGLRILGVGYCTSVIFKDVCKKVNHVFDALEEWVKNVEK